METLTPLYRMFRQLDSNGEQNQSASSWMSTRRHHYLYLLYQTVGILRISTKLLEVNIVQSISRLELLVLETTEGRNPGLDPRLLVGDPGVVDEVCAV